MSSSVLLVGDKRVVDSLLSLYSSIPLQHTFKDEIKAEFLHSRLAIARAVALTAVEFVD